MTVFNKYLKYFVIGFILIVIAFIFLSVIFGVSFLGNIFGIKEESLGEVVTVLDQEYAPETIELDIDSCKVSLKQGDRFVVRSSSSSLLIEGNENIRIIEKKRPWWNKKRLEVLEIIIPSSHVFKSSIISLGAGEFNVDTLKSNKLEMELGTGIFLANRLDVLESTVIKGGTGVINISDGEVYNLNMQLGVGDFTGNLSVLGNSKIQAGIGLINLSLKESLAQTQLDIQKGLGSVYVNGKEVSNISLGKYNNLIKIEGGVGDISISTMKE